MARNKTAALTPLELAIMRVIWEKGEVTVEDLSDAFDEAGRPLSGPSFRTMLGILQEKGYVKRRRTGVGRAYAYRAAVGADKAQSRILKDLVERAFEGSTANLVAALVRSKMVSKRELDKARLLIEEREKGDRT